MEKYSSGRRDTPAKGAGRETGARVRISPSPPSFGQLNLRFVFLIILIYNRLLSRLVTDILAGAAGESVPNLIFSFREKSGHVLFAEYMYLGQSIGSLHM